MTIQQPEQIVVSIEQVGVDPIVIEAPFVVLGSPGGGGGGFFEFTQDVPATSWTVDHNLGYFPAVTIVDDFDNEIKARVQQQNNNRVVVSFSQSQTGKVYCS